MSRIWDEEKCNVLFIMLNPFTAHADVDDPTIRRFINHQIFLSIIKIKIDIIRFFKGNPIKETMSIELILNPSISPIYITATNMIFPATLPVSILIQSIVEKIINAYLYVFIILIILIKFCYEIYNKL